MRELLQNAQSSQDEQSFQDEQSSQRDLKIPDTAEFNDERLWQFTSFDSWFFRESRPFDSAGGAVLNSQFPPPMRTLAGAIRTAIGEAHGVDWHRFHTPGDEVYRGLRQQIGDAQGYAALQMRGPYILKDGDPLFAAPLLLLKKDAKLVRLRPGSDAVLCDLGRVRLPALAEPLPGAAPLENTWLTRAGMEKVLRGEAPDTETDILTASQLFTTESRVGIGRNYRQRTNIEGLLYQTRHIRPQAQITLGVGVAGLAEEYLPSTDAIRLGGEGRFSAFRIRQGSLSPLAMPPLTIPTLITPEFSSSRFVIILLTPADFDGNWMPPGFNPEEIDGVTVWRGTLEKIPVRIVSAVLGKTVREGGWDMAGRQPRPMRSLVPAGSCYFCEVDGDSTPETLHHLARLHHSRIGLETQLGRGEIAVGAWDVS